MYRLVYVSTARDAVSSQNLQDILESAIRNNSDAEVTGTLLYNGPNFLQVLEGPEAAVREIYDRICSDARHSHVVTVLEERQTRRHFDDTPMQLLAVKSEAGQLPKGLSMSDELDLYLPTGLPAHLRQILKSFNTRKT
ncbi:BLUF domain-containing protein [Henriciella sp. AS95]|uniref:BLUF domain-containing protein n=1 Tax=Henriciella sp. AS95 TaxID=3135782 RepID=UPI003176DFB7